MSLVALVLILTAAGLHAVWNLLAKRSGGGVEFVWLYATATAVFFALPAVADLALEPARLGLVALAFVAGTGALHSGYFVSLQAGYRYGDLSLVYPLARAIGPLLSVAAAIVWLGERPGPVALAGAAVIVASVLTLTGRLPGDRTAPRVPNAMARRAPAFALLTGALIAAYTLWDKQVVGPLELPPVAYLWGGSVAESLLLLPFVARRRASTRAVWNEHRREVLGIALLSPLAYILVLYALSFTAVSYVAPAREVSILIGAAMGTQVLGEGQVLRRMWCAASILVGIVLLAAG